MVYQGFPDGIYWYLLRGIVKRSIVLLYLMLVAAPVWGQGAEAGVPSAPGEHDLTRWAPDTVLNALLDRLGLDFSVHHTEHFVVLHRHDPRWALEASRLLEKTYTRFYECLGAIGLRPGPISTRLPCIGFDRRADYDRYAFAADRVDMSWSDGYYSARTNLVALIQPLRARAGVQTPHETRTPPSPENAPPPGVAQETLSLSPVWGQRHDPAKVTHEAAHQLSFNSGLQTPGVMYPLWVSEGLATQFEIDPDHDLGLDCDNVVRRTRLVEVAERSGLLPLEKLVSLTRVPPGSRAASDLYAQCWGFFRFLCTERPEALGTYLGILAAKNPGWRPQWALNHEFAAVFGPLGPLQEQWAQFVESLRGYDQINMSHSP